MDQSEKKLHGIGVWCCYVVASCVLYVVSFGPACWIASRQPQITSAVETAYWPLGQIARMCPEPVVIALYTWGDVGTDKSPEAMFRDAPWSGPAFYIVFFPYLGINSTDPDE